VSRREPIDWGSDESHVLLNPRMPEPARAELERVVPPLRGHVFVATSGTSGALKLVALSKNAILASAAAVNARLGVTSGDIWARVLPRFHVGGLGIEARVFLAGAQIIDMEWRPEEFARTEATVVSMVPAQVHDLVRLQLRAPRGLRAVLVGGGAFAPELQEQARAYGWPVLASYGMSECASTISVEDVLLDHLEARVDGEGRVALRGSSLLTAYVMADGSVVDPKVDGWFVSEDFGDLEGKNKLHVRGRATDFVKVGGESVDLNRLDRILNSVRGDVEAAIVAVPDARLGHVIHLATTGSSAAEVVEQFNAQVLPFERVREVRRVASIPRSPLGKLLRRELLRLVE
jgi:O-succinylbenzoic acid--CoA ligase